MNDIFYSDMSAPRKKRFFQHMALERYRHDFVYYWNYAKKLESTLPEFHKLADEYRLFQNHCQYKLATASSAEESAYFSHHLNNAHSLLNRAEGYIRLYTRRLARVQRAQHACQTYAEALQTEIGPLPGHTLMAHQPIGLA